MSKEQRVERYVNHYSPGGGFDDRAYEDFMADWEKLKDDWIIVSIVPVCENSTTTDSILAFSTRIKTTTSADLIVIYEKK